MDNINNHNRKLIMIISVIIAFSLSTTYAFLNLTDSTNTASAQAGCFEVEYTAQEITSASITSSENYLEGSTSSQVTISKAENCEIYTEANIYIHTNNTTTAPINEYQALKYIVLDSSDETVAEGTITTTNESSDKLIATVDLTETATTYDIYIWVDSSVSEGNFDGTTYSGYIYAEAIQTSTVNQ